MKSTDLFSPYRVMIEPLEQRIAPALLVTGANLLGGKGNPTTAQTSIGGNTVTLVTVLSGEAIVWYEGTSITAISVGPNTSLDIVGNVGEIVGNLTASGHLSNSSGNASNGLDGDVLLPNNILGITTHPLSGQLGSVGEIITGGSVSNLNISGDLEGVYAGTGAFQAQSRVMSAGEVSVYTGVDVNPILPGVQPGFVFPVSNAKTVESGASITNVKMGAAEELQMFAGNGFNGAAGQAGLPGGSISGITINNAFVDVGLPALTASYDLLAGAGGSGKTGGAGGSIQNINEVSSNGVVDIIAGQGGVGIGAGGVGGSIKGLNMESVSSAYTVHAGSGGTGSPGGAGGSVTSVNFGGNQLSNGIIVSAPFTGGNVDDLLLVDSLTGTMVIEQNDGHGTGFTPVIQDSVTNLTTIAPVGETPVGAVAVDVNGEGLPDIVVAYKGTENLGVYINEGGGVFYLQDFSSGSYTGDTLEASSVSLPFAPTQIAAGNFTGDASLDLAVLATNNGQTELLTLVGNSAKANFTLSSTIIPLSANPVSLTTAVIKGEGYDDLFVGYKSGQIDALIDTGAASGAAFTVVNTGASVGGGIANLDFDFQDNLLLALNSTGDFLNTYESTAGGTLIPEAFINLGLQPGTALVAHFVPQQQGFADPIEVLSSISSGSRLDVYTPESGQYVLTSSTQSSEALKNFVPVLEGSTSGVAAVGGSLEHFAFSQNGAAFYDVGLPFSGKKVNIQAGDGGDGVNATTNIAAGGAGGEVFGMSILAGDITLIGGNGGSSENAAAGAGGMIADTPVLLTITGQSVPTILEADYVLTVSSGTGGSAGGTAHAATGGSGGSVEALNLSLLEGNLLINSGDGGNGGGGAGGNGGLITAMKSVEYGGDLIVAAGNGGAAAGAIGNGGAGGSIFNFTHTLTLTDQGTEVPYNVAFTAGAGGQSASAIGGAGGSVGELNLSLQPANESVTDANTTPTTTHTDTDSTLRVTVTAGNGGNGATGGAGGVIKTINATAVYDQLVVIVGETAADTSEFPEINPVTAILTAGNGGTGSKAAGGAGGSVTGLNLVGISHYDPDPSDAQAGQSPLVITSGNGGNGATTGGAGGTIMTVSSINAVFSPPTASSTTTTTTGSTATVAPQDLNGTELSGATIISGNGGNGGTGNGGAGGTLSNLSVGVSGFYQDSALSTVDGGQVLGGQLTIQSGSGGSGGTAGKGGAAGSITNSVVGCANAYQVYGLLLQGGVGGNGTLGGGTGGNVTNIQLNAPQNPVSADASYDVLSTLILAGNGGAVTGATAVGGVGGSISQISESKDVNSAINILQAGNGGAAVGTGGAGGSVTAVNTVGLIGQASDDNGNTFGAFQTAAAPGAFSSYFPGSLPGVPEGVFAGRGGTGATSGMAGSVTSITAAQIAAIGAAVNSSGFFAAASKVANITAESIAYDVNGNGLYDNASGTNLTPPSQAVPTDGFIFSDTVPTGIVTADNTLLKAFTFVA